MMWPNAEKSLIADNKVTLAVQVGGKLRGTIDVEAGIKKTKCRRARAFLAKRSDIYWRTQNS